MLQTGDIIKKLRIKNKYTQNELAIMLGLQLSTLQKYESGAIRNLKLETLQELCSIFEIPPLDLVFPNLSYDDKIGIIRWELREYMKLNQDGIDKVMTYINDIQTIEKYQKKST